METDVVLCDSNILIEFHKGNRDIVKALSKIGEPNIYASWSAIVNNYLLFHANDA